MGFIGDFFLPKHAFRALGAMAGGALPRKDEEGHRPGPREVVTGFAGTAAAASQAIGNRLFQNKPWAAKRLPGGTFTLGGLAVLVGWVVLVAGMAWFAGAQLLAGLRRVHLPPAAVMLGKASLRPGAPVKVEGWRDAHR
jgi:hypothetical protein